MKSRILLWPALLVVLIISTSFRHREWMVDTSLKGIEKDMVLIPGGGFLPPCYDCDVIMNPKAPDKIDSFYLYRYEVSNLLYKSYLYDLSRTDTAVWRAQQPDTAVWFRKEMRDDAYAWYYFQHPAYSNYPVVGVTHAQAEKFCDWLTNQYNSWPDRKFKKVKFCLPGQYEWEFAARGPSRFSTLPWETNDLTDEKGKPRANYAQVSQFAGRMTCGNSEVLVTSTVPKTNRGVDLNDYLTSVRSYAPDSRGIYNMAGNAEEMVSEFGITHGGGWDDPGYYLINTVTETYTDSTQTSAARGFRFAMKVLEK